MAKKSNTFGGWISPDKFMPHYEYAHRDRKSQFLNSVIGLRQSAHVIRKPSVRKKTYIERFVYAGCLHGGNEEIYERLKLLIKYPPDYLILSGDITGSPELEKQKSRFYDEKDQNTQSKYHKYEYFGDWAATLPKERRQKMLATLSASAEKLLKILQQIEKTGTKILIVEGNWDNPEISGLKAIADGDILDYFDTEKYIFRHGFKFINTLTAIETKTTVHIFLPFITLLKFEETDKNKVSQVKNQCRNAAEEGKTIIMVGHAEANWRVHYLWQKSLKPGGIRETVIENFGKAMAIFAPHEVIYPHQHARIRDEKKRLVDLNEKYLLKIRENKIDLVNDISQIGKDDKEIIAFYIPFGLLAEEEFIS